LDVISEALTYRIKRDVNKCQLVRA